MTNFLNILNGKKDVSRLVVPFLRDGKSLRDYQKIGASILYMNKKFILYDQMGFGKTVQSYSAYAMLRKKNPDLKLIYCTIKSGILQAENEFNDFFQGFKTVSVQAGKMSAKKREALYTNSAHDCYFLAHKTLVIDAKFIAKNLRPFVLVFDEANYFKGLTSKAHKIGKLFTRVADATWLLTADPIEKSLLDAYGLTDILTDEIFGNYKTFVQDFCSMRKVYTSRRDIRGRPIEIETISGFKNKLEFKRRFNSISVGRTRSDVENELPNLMVKNIFLDLPSKDLAIYKKIEDGILSGINAFSKMQDSDIEDIVLLENIARCRQILGCPSAILKKLKENRNFVNKNQKSLNLEKVRTAIQSGSGYDDDDLLFSECWVERFDMLIDLLEDYTLDTTVKCEEIEFLLENSLMGEKVIIFSSFKTVVDFLEVKLKKYKPLRITGSENSSVRESNRQKFTTSNDHNIMLITTAGIRALNLQIASTIICHDMPDTWGKLRQLIGRIIRIGSTHQFVKLICLMVNETVDEDHYKRLFKTQNDVEIILGNLDQDQIVDKETARYLQRKKKIVP